MHVIHCCSHQTSKKWCEGHADSFRGEDRGRPVAIKVVRLHIASDLETCLDVRPFRPGRDLPLIQLVVEARSSIARCERELENPRISERMDDGKINEQKHKEVNRAQLVSS